MEKEAAKYQIDSTDLKILQLLAQDAFTPFTEIAKKVHVAPGTVHLRMKKMEDAGIVHKPQLQIDWTQLGWDITAFIGVFLTKSEMYYKVVRELRKIPEVLSCHYTTGTYSLFLKIVCRDTRHLREVLHDRIQKIEGIARTETLISLEESFSRPLDAAHGNK
jgi:Lrp/AsnC family transcriptional regulator, regulator for asnA, asnC and gidA